MHFWRNEMKVLIVGAGMYVTGRNGTGTGTLLSSLAESSRTLPIEEVVVISKNSSSAKSVSESVERINKKIGVNLKVSHKAVSGDPESDIKKLCSETKFAAAIVSVPDHLHFPYTRELFKNGVH